MVCLGLCSTMSCNMHVMTASFVTEWYMRALTIMVGCVASQDGLEAGAAVTVEQLIQALQEEGATAWTRAADHLLRIGGARLVQGEDFCDEHCTCPA